MIEKPQTIDEYLSRLDPAPRAALERIRQLVTALVPEATETISYGMPTLLVQEPRAGLFHRVTEASEFLPVLLGNRRTARSADRLRHDGTRHQVHP